MHLNMWNVCLQTAKDRVRHFLAGAFGLCRWNMDTGQPTATRAEAEPPPRENQALPARLQAPAAQATSTSHTRTAQRAGKQPVKVTA